MLAERCEVEPAFLIVDIHETRPIQTDEIFVWAEGRCQPYRATEGLFAGDEPPTGRRVQRLMVYAPVDEPDRRIREREVERLRAEITECLGVTSPTGGLLP
jgi:hypothetical protein